jgi:mannose-1-phosphate guanylyltransferase/mannose-6-phosphate isomerase
MRQKSSLRLKKILCDNYIQHSLRDKRQIISSGQSIFVHVYIFGMCRRAEEMMPTITPVILCGGSGERLWPLSRKGYPKQFLDLIGEGSLFQQAATRLGRAAPLVITGDDYRFIARQQLHEAGVDTAEVIIEPEGRNTAPAILAAACHLAGRDPQSIMMVMPSDHYIPDAKAFAAMAETAATHLGKGNIICFGITPDRPETGYGYIKLGDGGGAIMPVATFTEKPDAELAEAFIEDGSYLWNAGIFMMRAGELLNIAADLQPEMLGAVRNAVENSARDLDFWRLDPAAWSEVPSESFDYAFMEKSPLTGCMAFSGAWSDLGDWQAVAREQEVDYKGNILHGAAHQIDSENSLLWAEKENQVLTGIGLDNIMAVAMGDAVMVADRARAQDVKAMVTALKKSGVEQAVARERENRPWGWFETIARGESFHAKVLHVDPGKRLSLQSHQYRSEHWVVVKGIATVVRGDEEFVLQTNESIYIHVGDKHQLRNEGSVELEIIEVQTGSYFGEDDIVRYNDVYNRS